MLKGIHLTLMMGPVVAVPAPKIVMDALTNIQVSHSKEKSGFQLSFSIDSQSLLLTTLLPAGYFDPIYTRVIIVVTLNGMPNVLIDGLITNQELSPSNNSSSTLTITGGDLSVAMDLVQYNIPYPNLDEVAIIYSCLARYARLGIVPVVIPPTITSFTPVTDKTKSQANATDNAFLKKLASDIGYIFEIQPGPLPGQSIAYFGPEVNLPMTQPALSIGLGSHTNVESLSFSLDGQAKSIRVFKAKDPITKKFSVPVPIPNLNFLKPPLGLKPLLPAKIEYDTEGAELKPTDTAKRILSFMMNNGTSITAKGSLDVIKYNGILKSRMQVGVRGAGLAYDGQYYVDSVTHTIQKGSYKQSFTLSRDGLIASSPFVLT